MDIVFLLQDIPRYREMVAQFYNDVAMLPVITDQEMGSAMQQLSAQQAEEFDTVAALKELYIYVTKYREPVSSIAVVLDFIYRII